MSPSGPEEITPTVAATPADVVPVQTNANWGAEERSSLISCESEPDHRPAVVVELVTGVPSGRKTPTIGCCPTLSIALTVAVEPIAFHVTTEPLYVAAPACVFANEL